MSKDYVEPPLVPLLDMEELKSGPFFRAVIAEFVATLLFLYVTVATVIGHKKQANQCDGVGLLGISLAFGGMIFVLVYCTAGISGVGKCVKHHSVYVFLWPLNFNGVKQWIFWVGPFIGALLAAAYHQYVLRASATIGLGSFRSNPATLNGVAWCMLSCRLLPLRIYPPITLTITCGEVAVLIEKTYPSHVV